MRLLILPFIFLASSETFGAEIILKSETVSEIVRDQEAQLEFTLRTEAKELLYDFSEGRPYYMTKMVASVEASSAEELKGYGIVQFIRSCIFDSMLNQDGSIDRSINTVRDFFGRSVPFKHSEWVIDSIDIDPLYWSSADSATGRTGLYRLDDPMTQQSRKDQQFLYKHLEQQKKYFVKDMPTGASEYYGEHTNVSLEFRTCLYRISDVPASSDPTGLEIQGKELKCLDWKSDFIFDYDTKNFQMGKDLHPFCLNP